MFILSEDTKVILLITLFFLLIAAIYVAIINTKRYFATHIRTHYNIRVGHIIGERPHEYYCVVYEVISRDELMVALVPMEDLPEREKITIDDTIKALNTKSYRAAKFIYNKQHKRYEPKIKDRD